MQLYQLARNRTIHICLLLLKLSHQINPRKLLRKPHVLIRYLYLSLCPSCQLCHHADILLVLERTLSKDHQWTRRRWQSDQTLKVHALSWRTWWVLCGRKLTEKPFFFIWPRLLNLTCEKIQEQTIILSIARLTRRRNQGVRARTHHWRGWPSTRLQPQERKR